jgi:hypothetical protein
MYIRTSSAISDPMLGVVNLMQLFFLILNWIVLLICLVSNRQRIVGLVNDGLQIEEDFSKIYRSKPWNLFLIIVICFKDIIYVLGNLYFNISTKKKYGYVLYYFRIVSGVFFAISVGFVENLKIIAHYHVSHLLGVLNNSLSRKRGTLTVETIREISQMYEKLLAFAENICLLLKFRTTIVLMSSVILISTEVQTYLNFIFLFIFNLP